jgi:glycosyltransferase involved in cell wall biosynthesis
MTGRHVLIVVQNLPVPLDRRVWLECRALIDAGYRVSVICPRGPGDPDYAEIDGVRIHKYEPAAAATGALGYLWEFAYSWVQTARLARRVWKRDPFDVLQACNPPDTYWALARLYRRRGVRFVYDQHDLNPEVFRSRFGEPRGIVARLQYRALLWLERQTFRTADHVISTNESYRDVAITRGDQLPSDVTVVRSGPDTARMRPAVGVPELREGRRHLAVYLGIMGPQDGVDMVLRMLHVLTHRMGRDDLHVALLGFGDCYDELVRLAVELDVADRVTFTGRADARTISEYLSTADVGIGPDPKSPLNDVSTMNKTMEYMSYAVPVVTFDLRETRVSAGDAAEYVSWTGDPDADEHSFAAAVSRVLDDAELRAEMAVAGRVRASAELDWAPQRARYVSVFDRVLGIDREQVPEPVPADEPAVDCWGHELVDLRDPDALRAFARDRGIPVRPETTGVALRKPMERATPSAGVVPGR